MEKYEKLEMETIVFDEKEIAILTAEDITESVTS